MLPGEQLKGGQEAGALWKEGPLLPREAVVAMTQLRDARAMRGKDHITRTRGIWDLLITN